MEAVNMVTTEEIMNTLFKAPESQVERFAEALVNAATEDSKMVDGSHLDKVFSFGLILMYCDNCSEPHWFVCFNEHGTDLNKSVPTGAAIDLIPMPTFEEAVRVYKDINNEDVRH